VYDFFVVLTRASQGPHSMRITTHFAKPFGFVAALFLFASLLASSSALGLAITQPPVGVPWWGEVCLSVRTLSGNSCGSPRDAGAKGGHCGWRRPFVSLIL
jgi:hypothetical protein